MKLRRHFCFAAALMLLVTGWASASPVTLSEFEATNFSGPTWEGGIVPFDHTLGTLTSVSVTITGTLSATVQTFLNLSPPPDVIPIPTPFTFFVNQNFSGLVGLFSFANPVLFQFNGTGSGAGEQQTLVASFVYGFRFDSSTDFTGMTADPVVGLISGTRAGFTDTFAPLLLEQMTTSGFIGSGGFPVTSSADGTILVEYDYTPAPTPEPATLLLMVSGLAGISVRLRRLWH